MKARRPEPLLLVIPFVYLLLSFWMMEVRGPYNLGLNIDPEYVALMNSLNLATARSSHYFQHPATTTQIAGTAAIAGKWLAGGFTSGSLGVAVVKDHLEYLRAINLLHLLLLLVAAYFAGLSVKRASGSAAAALAVQCTPLLYQTVIEALPRVAPELMEVVVGLALLIPLAPVLFGRPEEARRPVLAFAAGALLAAGVATKANFFTLGLLVLLFPGWKQKARFLGAAAAALAALLIPVAGAWRGLVSWFVNMATRSGTYGEGEAGLPSATVYWNNLTQIYSNEPFLFWLTAVYAAALVVTLVEPEAKPYRKLFGLGVLIIVVHVIITGKHFNYHYSLPAALVTIPMNALLILFLLKVPLRRYARAGLIVLAVWVGYETGRHNLFRMKWYATWKQEYKQHISALEARRGAEGDCRLIGYYRSSAPTYALAFGNDLSALIQHGPLENVYPGEIHFTGGRFHHWDHRDARDELKAELEAGRCILLQGQTDNLPALGDFTLQPLFTPERPIHGAEGLYRLGLPDV